MGEMGWECNSRRVLEDEPELVRLSSCLQVGSPGQEE